jgi:hypothetical protein
MAPPTGGRVRRAPHNDYAELAHLTRLANLIDPADGPAHDHDRCWDDFADSQPVPLIELDPDVLRGRYSRWHETTHEPHPMQGVFIVQYLAWISGNRGESPVWGVPHG